MNAKLVLTDAQKLERFSSKKQTSKQNSISYALEKSNVSSHESSEILKESAIENMSGSMNRYISPTDSKSLAARQGNTYDRLLMS